MVSEQGDRYTEDGSYKLLDHGYVKLIESWGSDERIIEAARMSTAKGFLGWDGTWICKRCDYELSHEQALKTQDADGSVSCPSCDDDNILLEHKEGDTKLLRFLWKNHHSTPFEMAGFTIEVQAPIFVFREWHRHRTQSYNELSARYTPLPDMNYVPSVERLMMKGGKNKQAQGTGAELTREKALSIRHVMREDYKLLELDYQSFLQSGVPKELARLIIPVGRYSRMRASTDLRNWLGFLKLRMGEDAQWEIRQYANVVGELVSKLFPRTWQLFREGM